MALEKIYTPIGWQNKPSTATPLGSHNLSKIDEALAEIDERVVELSEDTEVLDGRVEDAETDITKNADDITRLDNRFTGFSTAMSQGMELLFDRVEEAEAKTEKNTEDINALKIIPTASGTTAYMDDASNMNLENIIFYGESTQMQTTGKNLLKFSQGSTTNSGITFTVNADKSVTVNGKATEDAVLLLTTSTRGEVDLNSLTGKNIILSGCPSGGSGTTYKFQFWSASKWAVDTGNGATLDLSTVPDTWNFAISIISGTTINNLTFYPMIRLASVTDGTYEPYTGGKASPSPDYPQPIESKIVNRVDVRGTNQLPNELKSRTEGGLTIDSTPERIKVTGTTLRGVTVSVCDTKIESKKGLFAKGAAKLEGLSYVARVHNYSTGAMEYWVIGTKGRYIEPGWTIERVYIQQMNADVTVDAEIQPQIVVGNVDLPFEPYQSQTKSLASGTYRLDGIGDLKNYYDAKRGVYGEKVDRVTFDGSDDEAWSFGTTNNGRRMQINIPVKPVSNVNVKGNVLCNRYIVTTAGENYMEKQGIAVDTSSRLYVYDANFKSSLISDWKAYLKANPMTVVYELAEPEEGNLISSVKDDFAEFLKLHTYKPNTVVMNGADAEMDVHYVADPRLYIDKKFEALASAIVNQ